MSRAHRGIYVLTYYYKHSKTVYLQERPGEAIILQVLGCFYKFG
jgi:hypothetical protein